MLEESHHYFHKAADVLKLSDKIRQIIRTQWTRRHSRNPLVRAEARNLIRVHVQLLRNQASLARGNDLGIAEAVRDTPVADAA